jgi:hypothetical protein
VNAILKSLKSVFSSIGLSLIAFVLQAKTTQVIKEFLCIDRGGQRIARESEDKKSAFYSTDLVTEGDALIACSFHLFSILQTEEELVLASFEVSTQDCKALNKNMNRCHAVYELSIYCRSKRIHTPERWRRRESKGPRRQVGRGLIQGTRWLVDGRLIGLHAES